MNYNILMVCTGNICRSPMAEVMLRDKLSGGMGNIVNVSSAGINAMNNNRATQRAIETMDALGIDLTEHKARFLTLDLLKDSDLVLVMERVHLRLIHNLYRSEKEKTFMLSSFCQDKKKNFDIPDPYGESIRVYKKSAALIEKCLGGVIEHINDQNLV